MTWNCECNLTYTENKRNQSKGRNNSELCGLMEKGAAAADTYTYEIEQWNENSRRSRRETEKTMNDREKIGNWFATLPFLCVCVCVHYFNISVHWNLIKFLLSKLHHLAWHSMAWRGVAWHGMSYFSTKTMEQLNAIKYNTHPHRSMLRMACVALSMMVVFSVCRFFFSIYLFSAAHLSIQHHWDKSDQKKKKKNMPLFSLIIIKTIFGYIIESISMLMWCAWHDLNRIIAHAHNQIDFALCMNRKVHS